MLEALPAFSWLAGSLVWHQAVLISAPQAPLSSTTATMPRNAAAKRLFSTLARHAEFSASGLIAPGQALLAQRSTIQVLGGAGASAAKVSGVRGVGQCGAGPTTPRHAPLQPIPRPPGHRGEAEGALTLTARPTTPPAHRRRRHLSNSLATPPSPLPTACRHLPLRPQVLHGPPLHHHHHPRQGS